MVVTYNPVSGEAYCAWLGWLCILVTRTQLLCLVLYVLKVANMCDTGVSPSYIPPYLGPTACHLTGLSDGEQSLAHRMHLLKGRLLHFISSVESYLMTRVSGTDSQPRSDIHYHTHCWLLQPMQCTCRASLVFYGTLQILHTTGLDFQRQLEQARTAPPSPAACSALSTCTCVHTHVLSDCWKCSHASCSMLVGIQTYVMIGCT